MLQNIQPDLHTAKIAINSQNPKTTGVYEAQLNHLSEPESGNFNFPTIPKLLFYDIPLTKPQL